MLINRNIITRKQLNLFFVMIMAAGSFNPVLAQESSTATVPAGSTAAAPTTPAASEAQPSVTAAKQVERIEVVGTRIKRIATEGASAVKNIGKENMENSANVSVSDTLRDSNVATFGVSREASGSNAAATTNIGLRGLGSTRTLVLLNGHRLPKDPSTEAVDLNLIPESAVERIEVLKDGASALYGSDALGGVINIVTKKGYVGNEVLTKFSAPELKGGSSLSTSLLSGSSSDKSDLLLVLNFNRDEKIFGKDREITKNGLSPTGSTAAYRDASGKWFIDPSGNCPADLVKPDASGNGNRCYFRYNEIATTRPLVNTINLLSDYIYRLDSGAKFYNRNLVVFKEIEWNYAPAPGTFSTASGTSTIPAARKVAYRFMEAGNRDNKDTERNYSTLFGLKGNLTDTWEYDASVGFSRIFRENLGVNGYLDANVLGSLVKNGDFDPFKAEGNRGDLSSAVAQVFQQSESSLFTTDLVFSGEIGQMEHGPIGTAVGVSFFNEKLDQRTDNKSAAGIIIGSAGSNDKGGRDVTSVFSEFNLPVTEKLEVNVAARADHYSDFGNTINPKLAAKYQMDSSTLLRASVGTGFKAPTLSQLYGSSSEGYPTFIDRKACAQNSAACEANQYLVTGGGNRDLKEEKAVTAGVGGVYEASSDFSTSLDLWYTKISNVVGIDLEEMTKAELNGVDPSKYGVTVTRDSNGIIDSIKAPNLNLQEEEISGADLNAEVGLMNNLYGHRLSVQDDLSYLLFYKKEGFPGAGKRNIIGEWGYPGWRNNLSFNLKNDKTMYKLTVRTIPGQKVMDNTKSEKLTDLNELDLAVGYKISKTAQLTGGIKNLLNTNQPADMNGGSGGAAEVNGDLYDVNGRKAFVGYSQKF